MDSQGYHSFLNTFLHSEQLAPSLHLTAEAESLTPQEHGDFLTVFDYFSYNPDGNVSFKPIGESSPPFHNKVFKRKAPPSTEGFEDWMRPWQYMSKDLLAAIKDKFWALWLLQKIAPHSKSKFTGLLFIRFCRTSSKIQSCQLQLKLKSWTMSGFSMEELIREGTDPDMVPIAKYKKN